MKKQEPAKRIDIVSVYMVKERSVLYQERYIQSPRQVVHMMNEYFKMDSMDRESFVLIAMDAKCRPTHISVISQGSLTASIVHPREVFKAAILASAHSIVVAHNHPSGNPQPSREDIKITNRLKDVGEIMGIPVVDHLIIGEDEKYVSLKEEGYL